MGESEDFIGGGGFIARAEGAFRFVGRQVVGRDRLGVFHGTFRAFSGDDDPFLSKNVKSQFGHDTTPY